MTGHALREMAEHINCFADDEQELVDAQCALLLAAADVIETAWWDVNTPDAEKDRDRLLLAINTYREMEAKL